MVICSDQAARPHVRGVDADVLHADPLNLDNKPLYATTFMSFVYAYGHFIIENLVYHTSTAANLGTYAVVAG
jgi:hypothetical protein